MRHDLKTAENFWIQAAREPTADGAIALIYYVFGFKPEPFHIEWIRKIYSDLEENRNQDIVAPRGSAKTTYLCILLLKYISDHPWDANGLISVSATQAKERLAFIRNAFNNERYIKVYPWIKVDNNRPDTQLQFSIWDIRYTYGKWRSDISKMGGDFKSPTMAVAGTGGRGITGSRITGVLAFDDVSDQDNARTEDLREQLWKWLTDVVMPILSGNHYRIWAVHTRWAEGDVPSRLKASGVFVYNELKAITRVGDQLKSFWPKLFNFKELLKILNRDGKTSFLLARMNSITGLSGAIFTADMLRTDLPRDHLGKPIFPEFDKIIISVDAALKAKEASDDSALAMIGIVQSPNTGLPQMWLIKMMASHLKNMEVITHMENWWHQATANYKAREYSVLIETVAGQQLFLTLMDQKPDFSIPKHLIDTYAPISDKGTRARSTAAAGERGDLLVDMKASWYDKWFSQCIEFTGSPGSSDDMVDVMTQVGVREFGDIASTVSFSPNVTLAHINGLTL